KLPPRLKKRLRSRPRRSCMCARSAQTVFPKREFPSSSATEPAAPETAGCRFVTRLIDRIGAAAPIWLKDATVQEVAREWILITPTGFNARRSRLQRLALCLHT